jgi:hypothetical protein
VADTPRAHVQIVGDHPHEGCLGTIGTDSRVVGEMIEVRLTSCEHLVESCFAKVENLTSLPHRRGGRRG